MLLKKKSDVSPYVCSNQYFEIASLTYVKDIAVENQKNIEPNELLEIRDCKIPKKLE